jgi:glycosyltransferase involved in cell wall biosynthesis
MVKKQLRKTSSDVSVIVPAYNEEGTIVKVINELLVVKTILPSMEIIVIDDGSTDATVKRIFEFLSIKIIRQPKNMGKGAALRTGFEAARGRVIIVQDADMEYSPSDIPNLVKPILSGEADVVYGSRFACKPCGMSYSHFFGNILLSMAASLLYGQKITDVMTGYKAFSRKIIRNLHLTENGFSVETELTCQVLQNGCRYREVPISYSYRSHGVSKIKPLDGFKSLIKLFSIYFRTEAP